MGEFDESVRVALRERAEGAVLVEELLAGARRRGVWRRRFRHALLGCGTASAVTVAVLLAAFVIAPPSAIEMAEGEGGSALPRPPVAGPGEGNLLRLDTADPDANRLEWATDSFDKQLLHVGRARSLQGFHQYLVMLGRSEPDLESLDPLHRDAVTARLHSERVMIGARYGMLWLTPDWALLRWQRGDGGWLGVSITFEKAAERKQGADRAAVIQVAQWVRSNVAYRCVADFRLNWTPPGSHLIGCQLSIMPGYRRYGQRFAADNGITFLAYTEPGNKTEPAEVYSSAAGQTAALSLGVARYPFGVRVLAVEAAPILSPEDSLRIVFAFTPLDDPIPDR